MRIPAGRPKPSGRRKPAKQRDAQGLADDQTAEDQPFDLPDSGQFDAGIAKAEHKEDQFHRDLQRILMGLL